MWLLKLLKHLLLQRKSSERNDPQPWVSSAAGSTWGPLLPTQCHYGSEHKSIYKPTANESLQVLQKIYYWEKKISTWTLDIQRNIKETCSEATLQLFLASVGQNKPKSLVLSKLALCFSIRPYTQNKFVRKGKYFSSSHHHSPFLSSEEVDSTFLLRV